MNKKVIHAKELERKSLVFLIISIFLFLTNIFAYANEMNSYAQSKNFTIKLENKTVKDVIEYIEKNSDFIFMYSKKSLPSLDKVVSIEVVDGKIDALLNLVTEKTGLNFFVKDFQIILSNREVPEKAQQSQQSVIKISGAVYDENEQPIPGANVYVKGTTNGVVTDYDGLFTINASNNSTLVVSFVGYQQSEIAVKGKKNIVVNLVPDNKVLEEVVVVGFGTQKKASVVGAVQTIKPSELRIPSSNISNALGGRLAGVVAVQRSGEPGADGSTFWIRGISTFSASTSPLIFIDNVEASTGDLNALPPEAIEGFSILKDAAATALYGARGANGVMLVTTRSGKNMEKAKVNFRLTNTFAAPTQIVDIADGVDYMNMYNEATMSRNPATDPSTLRFSQDKIQGTIEGRNPYIYPNVDWMNFLFKKMTINQSANLNVTGGTKKIDYFVSASINNDNGMLKSDPNNKFDNNIRNLRYSFQANVNVMLTSTTKIGVKLNSQILNYKGSSAETSTIFKQVYESPGVYFAPTLPALAGEDHILFGNATGGPINQGGGRYFNPYATMVSGYNDRNESTLITTFNIDQKLDFVTKGLMLKGLVSFKNWSQTNIVRSFDPYYYKVTDYSLQDGAYSYEYEAMNTGRSSLGTTPSSTGDRLMNLQFILDYNRHFGKHDVSGMLVYLQRDYSLNNPGDFYASLPQRNQGFAGRATYAFDDRYLAEFNFGYNGSENFKKGSRFGFFPSFALGYVISNETFFKSLSNVITNLKLRGTYGLVGNSFTNPKFPYLTQVNLGGWGYQFGNLWQTSGNGAVVTKYGTENAHWEIGRKFNVGIDLGLISKLNLTVDYFLENRKDIFLQRRTIPSELGLVAGAAPYANLGKVQNQGVDLSLDYNHAINKDLIISAKGTFTYAKNKLIDRDEPVVDYPYLSDLGQPLDRTRGLIAVGLFKDAEDVANSPVQTYTPTVLPGDIKYADLNEDGKIDDQDKTQFGYSTKMPQIIYGLGGSVQYKKWDFSLFFQGVAQTSIQMSGMHPFGGDANTVLKYVAENYWSEKDPNMDATYPRLDLSINQNNSQPSTFWSRDGSFVRLKNVELGYSFKFIRVYLAGQNLFTFSKFKYWDPELGSGKGLSYPTMVSGTIGAQLTF